MSRKRIKNWTLNTKIDVNSKTRVEEWTNNSVGGGDKLTITEIRKNKFETKNFHEMAKSNRT